VLEVMLPFFLETYANPSSTVHQAGREAAMAVEKAREQVAGLIDCRPGEILFTSGATESNNLALLGAVHAAPAGRNRILAGAIEHKSVLEPCRLLGGRGFEFATIPVHHDGQLDLAALVDFVDEHTAVVSVQAANNEIGTLQPLAEVAQIAHRVGAVVHCDAAQAPGRIPIDVRESDVDLLSVSGHKCYGPKGVGALYVKGGMRTAPLAPIMTGGGQEHGLRPGTLNVPGIVGFGRAAELAIEDLAVESRRVSRLRDELESFVMSRFPGAHRNGAECRRLAGNSSLTFPGVEADALVVQLTDVVISTGSACTSGAPEPSHVLTAIGLSREEASGTVRLGLGRFTLETDVEYAARRLVEVALRVRELLRSTVPAVS
jgi:cysteine desulfurase